MSPAIRINLLKNRRVLSEKDYLREKKFLQISVVSLVIVFVITVAMAIWNFALSQRLLGIEESITEANKQMQGLATANAEQVYVKNRLSLIGGFLDDQSVARESLQQILALSLPGISIGGITFESESEVMVTVTAESVVALSSAIEYYKRDDAYFPQVVSQGMSRNKDGLYEMRLVLTLPTNDKEKS